MAIKTLFFNDVDYYAEDFIKPFKSITGNGVLSTNDLLVTATNPNNLSVDVAPGKAFMEGHYIELDITTNIPITANTSGFNRIDTLCLKLDKNTKQSILTVIQGTPSGSPVAPTIPTNDGEYYISLANIVVGNNSSAITAGNITDKRTIYFKGHKHDETYIPFITDNVDMKYIPIIINGNHVGNIGKTASGDNLYISSINGNAGLFSKGRTVIVDGTLYAFICTIDNAMNNGAPTNRWKQVYAATSTISTSDRRYKQQIGPIPDTVLDAWSEVNYNQFKFNDAVEEKGEDARWHIGLIAQDIEEAFIRRGLDAFGYGLLCKDLKEDGTYIYSIRPDECQFLELALMRRELNKLKGLA